MKQLFLSFLLIISCILPCMAEQKPDVPQEIRHGGKSCVDYIKLSINDFGRADFRFSDLSKSKQYSERYQKPPVDTYETIEIYGQICYGGRMFDAGQGPVIYLIVDEGIIEAIPVDKIVEGEYETTLHSIANNFVDIQLVDGVVKGVNADKEVVDIEWKEKTDPEND